MKVHLDEKLKKDVVPRLMMDLRDRTRQICGIEHEIATGGRHVVMVATQAAFFLFSGTISSALL